MFSDSLLGKMNGWPIDSTWSLSHCVRREQGPFFRPWVAHMYPKGKLPCNLQAKTVLTKVICSESRLTWSVRRVAGWLTNRRTKWLTYQSSSQKTDEDNLIPRILRSGQSHVFYMIKWYLSHASWELLSKGQTCIIFEWNKVKLKRNICAIDLKGWHVSYCTRYWYTSTLPK